MVSPAPLSGPTVTYAGLIVRFCCPGCDVTFLGDPEKFLAKDAPAGQAWAVSLFDPVSGQRIEFSDAAATRIVGGVLYPFATTANAEEFDVFPGSYAARPARESLTCPVMKTKLSDLAAATGYADRGGIRYYFCCDGCDDKFASDPAKYSASVAAVVRPAARPLTSTATEAERAPSLTLAPTCAGCAGEARLMSDGGFVSRWMASYRFLATDDVAARHRWTLDYAVTPRVSVGIERSGGDTSPQPVTPFADNPLRFLRDSDGDAPILPRASWFASPQGKTHPSVLFGFISDRLSTPRGQAFFATFAYTPRDSFITPFVSVKTNTTDGKTVFPFGGNVAMGGNLVLQVVNDGDYTHFLLSKLFQRTSVSMLYAKSRHWGFSVAVGF